MEELNEVPLTNLIAEVQTLEEAYANELAAGADRNSLNLIHDKIKKINSEINKRQQTQNRGYSYE